MAGCITSDYKDILIGAFKAELESTIIAGIIQSIPLCSGAQVPGGKSVEIRPRKVGTEWPEAIFYDKDGTTKTGSFSGLYKELFGFPVTSKEGYICRTWHGADKIECRSPSTLENWHDKGYIVKGNGEEPPMVTPDMEFDDVERQDKAWKDKLRQAGLKIHIYHPEHPSLKEATKSVEKTAKKKK